MENKEKFYHALIIDNGEHDEITIGESLGLDEDVTMKIISALLSEFKIEYKQYGLCNYKVSR